MELQKPLHILAFDQEKGKATYIEMYGTQKAKGLLTKLKYQKLQASILLGSKDLGTNVFRTLMCIVGKP